jgi:hypothetical protein
MSPSPIGPGARPWPVGRRGHWQAAVMEGVGQLEFEVQVRLSYLLLFFQGVLPQPIIIPNVLEFFSVGGPVNSEG